MWKLNKYEPIEIKTPKGFLVVEGEVLEKLAQYKQTCLSAPEQGGILMGEYRDPHIRICKMTDPGPNDRAGRYSFFRHSKFHNMIARAQWLKSMQKVTYLGEWHTHPEDHPTPSGTDHNSWRKNLPRRSMILAIQGRKSIWWGLWDGESIISL